MNLKVGSTIAMLTVLATAGCNPLGSAIGSAIDSAYHPGFNSPSVSDAHFFTTKNVSAGGTLTSTDPQALALKYILVTGPRRGNVTLDADTGAFLYTPNSSITGNDTFTFKTTNGSFESSIATVTISISNTRPTLTNVSTLSLGTEDTAFVISYASLLAASDAADIDGDTISFRISSVIAGPLLKNGSPVVIGTTLVSPGDSLSWSPVADTNGILNAFTLRSFDGTSDSLSDITVSAQLSPVNDAPVMNAIGAQSTNEDVSKAVTFTISDVDNSLDCEANMTMSSTNTTLVPNANVVWSGTAPVCTATITPAANAYGASNLTFTVTDGALSATRSFALTVAQLSDDPVSSSWPFDALSEAAYSFTPSLIQFTGGIAELIGLDRIENSAAELGSSSGAVLKGLTYGTLSDGSQGLKLGSDGSCDGSVTNCANQAAPEIYELNSSWTPQWSNVVGYWKMNGNWNDSKGINHGSSVGSAGFSSSAKIGSMAGVFPGLGSYLTVPHDPSLTMAKSMTITLWIYYTGVDGSYPALVAKGTGGGVENYFLGLLGGGPNVYFTHNNSGWQDVSAGMALNSNAWNFVAVSVNGNNYSFVVNGAETQGTNASPFIANAGSLYLGESPESGSAPKGRLDDVAIWNVPLSVQELQAIYRRQSTKYSGVFESRVMDAGSSSPWTTLSWLPTLPFFKELPDYASGAIQTESSSLYSSLVGSTGSISDSTISTTNLVALWHLDEAAGTSGSSSIRDDSGQGHSGTPTSTTITFGGPGRFSKAATTSGNGYISVPSISLGTGIWTVSSWFTYPLGTCPGFCTLTRGNNDHQILVNPTSLKLGSYDNVGGTGFKDSGYSLSGLTAGWHHLAAVAVGGSTIFYIDGVSVGTIGWRSTDNIIDIGNWRGGGQAFGSIDEVAIWSRALHANEIKQLYQRGASRLKFQVRTCTTNPCTTETWKGSDGTSATYFSELNNNTVALDGSGDVKTSPPRLTFLDFASPFFSSNRQYFQYRSIFESDGTAASYGPELKSISIGPMHYPAEATIYGNNGVVFYDLASFAQTLGSTNGCSGGVGYNLSLDKTNWKYWNGSAWASADGTFAQTNPASSIQTHASTFGSQIGRGTVYFKAFLESSGTTPCELDNIAVTGTK
ncbi:MAG: LamG-like jellyroll fold domain-containing protein [Bdellovibrionota bacterium]